MGADEQMCADSKLKMEEVVVKEKLEADMTRLAGKIAGMESELRSLNRRIPRTKELSDREALVLTAQQLRIDLDLERRALQSVEGQLSYLVATKPVLATA